MLKERELRIGNYALSYGFPVRVSYDTFKQLSRGVKYNPIPLTEDWLKRFGFEEKEMFSWKGNGADYQTENSKTEQKDFVLKVGVNYFVFRFESWYWRASEKDVFNCETSVHIGIVDSHYENVTLEHTPIYRVVYVHELQNLYHALTGKELTLKTDQL